MPTKGELLGVTAPTAGQVTHLPVMMLDSTGAPVTGVAWDAAGMAVEIAKPGGAFVAWATAVGNAWATTNWAEVGRGLYRIIISGDVAGEAALLDTEGHLAAYVAATATRGDVFLYKVNPADVARVDEWTAERAAVLDDVPSAATWTEALATKLGEIWRRVGFGAIVRDAAANTVKTYDGDAAAPEDLILTQTGVTVDDETTWTPTI